jgi:hypothetical protein
MSHGDRSSNPLTMYDDLDDHELSTSMTEVRSI